MGGHVPSTLKDYDGPPKTITPQNTGRGKDTPGFLHLLDPVVLKVQSHSLPAGTVRDGDVPGVW